MKVLIRSHKFCKDIDYEFSKPFILADVAFSNPGIQQNGLLYT